jgi:hypothetical protein
MAKKQARGRPPKGTEPMGNSFALRLRGDQLEMIDEVIAEHPHLNDRNSVVRDLIDRGAEDLRAEIKLLADRNKGR